MNLALIGCGSLGKTHARCISQIDGARFIAWCDVVDAAAQAALDEFGGEYATTDVQRVLDDDRIEAVYICTLHDSHASLAIAAARAGKHILIEKPLALNMTDCEAIAREVEKAGVYLMPAFKMRYYPLVQQAHAFIPKPMLIVGQMMDNRWSDDKWAQDPIKGGANVHSQGCHTTDILRYFAGGEPQTIWAAGGAMTHPGHACIDQCVASIRFDNGCVASWIQGDAGLGPFTSKFFFELFSGDGKVVQLHDRLKRATFTDNGKTWTEQRDDEEGFQLENQEFIAALREKRPPALDADDGIQATRIVLAADEAIRTSAVQSLHSYGRAAERVMTPKGE
jgi:predicted dehydrogenase